MTECINNGNVSGKNYNVAGFAAYVDTSYQETRVKADYTDNTITVVIGNTSTSGEYELKLETADIKNLHLVEGAVYTIYDADKNIIPGCESVVLENGTLKIAKIDINNLGVDTYYIKENKTVEGYNRLNGVIKLKVKRKWDKGTNSYIVGIDSETLSNEEYLDDEISDDVDIVPSRTGKIYERTNFTNVTFTDSYRSSFTSCSNNGVIRNEYMNAGGIVAAAHSRVKFEGCNNTSLVEATVKAGGMAAEIYAWKVGKVEVINCSNSGQISSKNTSSTNYYGGTAAGMVGHTFSDINLIGCTNTGIITAGRYAAAAGIVADACGNIKIDSCLNNGMIVADTGSSNDDVNCMAAGILAKNSTNAFGISISHSAGSSTTNIPITVSQTDNILQITNCESKANIVSTCHVGGIVSSSTAYYVDIKNCKTQNAILADLASGDRGGIIAYVSSQVVKISGCEVDGIGFSRTSGRYGVTYGSTGGIAGNSYNSEIVQITNCRAINSRIYGWGKEPAGILALAHSEANTANIIIADCYVADCEIHNMNGNSTYSKAAGLLATVVCGNKVTVSDCKVERVDINASNGRVACGGAVGAVTTGRGTATYCLEVKNIIVSDSGVHNVDTGGDANVGGVVGWSEAKYNKVINCNVVGTYNTSMSETDETDNVGISNVSGNLGGIVGGVLYSCTAVDIEDCTVKDIKMKSTASNGSNAVTGGIIADGSTDYIYAKNCTINNVNINHTVSNDGSGTNVTGILGYSSGSAKLENCNAYNSEIYSNARFGNLANVTAIAGYVSQNADIINCKVDSTKITATKAANTTGLLGCCNNGEANIKQSKVIGCEITSSASALTNAGNSTVAGLIGRSNKCTIENSSVENSDIIGEGNVMAGIIASTNQLDVDNISLTKVNITDNGVTNSNSYSRSIGGVVGSTNKLNSDKAEIEDLRITGKSTSIGGIAGYASQVENLANSNVNKLKIDNATGVLDGAKILKSLNGSVAGFIGDLGNGTFTKNTITNSEIIADSDNVAGAFGTISGNSTIDECIVDNVKLTNRNLDNDVVKGSIGGIVSYTGDVGGKVELTNSAVKNSTLTIEGEITDAKNAGGIVAFVAADIKIENTDVENTTINNNTLGNTGGLVGATNYIVNTSGEITKEAQLTINNANIINCSRIVGNFHTGGMLGFGKLIAESGRIIGTTIVGKNTQADVGSIIGNALNSSNILNITVEDSTPSDKAGLIGIEGLINKIIIARK